MGTRMLSTPAGGGGEVTEFRIAMQQLRESFNDHERTGERL